jgi:hypothetical protein
VLNCEDESEPVRISAAGTLYYVIDAISHDFVSYPRSLLFSKRIQSKYKENYNAGPICISHTSVSPFYLYNLIIHIYYQRFYAARGDISVHNEIPKSEIQFGKEIARGAAGNNTMNSCSTN